MVIRLELVHYTPAVYDKLRQQLEDCKTQISVLQSDYRALELRYGAEIQYNNALIDLLRSHGIPFRSVLSHSVRVGNPPKL